MIIVAIDETTFERSSEIIEDLDSKKCMVKIGSVAFNSCMDELLGLGFNHSIDEEERIENITLEQVKDVSNRYFNNNNYAVAISTPAP